MPYFVFDKKRIFYRDEGNGDLLLLLPGNTASYGELCTFVLY